MNAHITSFNGFHPVFPVISQGRLEKPFGAGANASESIDEYGKMAAINHWALEPF
jgi:hypothetical protein